MYLGGKPKVLKFAKVKGGGADLSPVQVWKLIILRSSVKSRAYFKCKQTSDVNTVYFALCHFFVPFFSLNK